MLKDYYYTDKEELDALRVENAKLKQEALALFSVLYEIIEKDDPENVSSKIDYLTKQNNSSLSDAYKMRNLSSGGSRNGTKKA